MPIIKPLVGPLPEVPLPIDKKHCEPELYICNIYVLLATVLGVIPIPIIPSDVIRIFSPKALPFHNENIISVAALEPLFTLAFICAFPVSAWYVEFSKPKFKAASFPTALAA